MKTILMTVLVTMTTVVGAQEATPDTWASVSGSTLSRAEVRAQAVEARQTGQLAVFDEGYLPAAQSTLLRAQVIAELVRSRQSGEYAQLWAEAYNFEPVRPQPVYAARFAGMAKR